MYPTENITKVHPQMASTTSIKPQTSNEITNWVAKQAVNEAREQTEG